MGIPGERKRANGYSDRDASAGFHCCKRSCQCNKRRKRTNIFDCAADYSDAEERAHISDLIFSPAERAGGDQRQLVELKFKAWRC